MLEQAVCAGDVGNEGWAMEVLGSKSEVDMIFKNLGGIRHVLYLDMNCLSSRCIQSPVFEDRWAKV